HHDRTPKSAQSLDFSGFLLCIFAELPGYLPNACNISDLLQDGFGARPFFQCLVAEAIKEDICFFPDPDIVGFAMYYYTYDPWIGRMLYLEDFYVMDEYRGWGIGSELLKRLSQIAIDAKCNCMHFLVVVWNQPSIEYYMRRGASDLSTEEGWHLFRFDKEHLVKMASGE
uniref:N-acetyltransferase domain-containing protein n=1 Tax=Varanus komodoensis TaxID=61221 RepID=A0A8D2LII6_VARKO